MGCLFSCVASAGASAACGLCSCCVEFTLSQASRFGHALILFLLFTLAVILGTQAPNYFADNSPYSHIHMSSGCSSDWQDSCVYRQMVYRASFSLFVVFAVIGTFAYCSDLANRGFWIVKFSVSILFFVGLWWGNNDFFSGWAELCRAVSFLMLLVQGLLYIDFAHDLHDILIKESDNPENYIPQAIYLTLSAVAVTCAAVGLAFLFKDYTDCGIGMFFTITTLVVGAITTFLSLLNTFNKGLLTPCLVLGYSVFMCWYALLSNPSTDCNPAADSLSDSDSVAVAIIATITFVVVMYCVVNGTRIFDAFDPSGQGVMMTYQDKRSLDAVLTGGSAEEGRGAAAAAGDGDGAPGADASGSPKERLFFCVLMLLVACYGSMILTNWGKTNGAPSGEGGSDDASYASQWLKIVSQWLFLAFYSKILHAAYITNNP